MSSTSHFQLLLLLLLLLSIVAEVQVSSLTFNVIDFGARGDGRTNDTQAFYKAWQRTCSARAPSTIFIPEGNFLVGPMVLSGPCKASIGVYLSGVLWAPIDEASLSLDYWISFRHLDGLTMHGGGALNGQGSFVWGNKTSSKNPNAKPLHYPISLRYDYVNNAQIKHISFINSKGFHLNIFSCDNITIDSININTPSDSPNTDGIHIGISKNIQILNSQISTGDDCVSIGPGTNNINISNVQCGPGHGISIGSLGAAPNEGDVIGVHVTNCNLTNTMYGVRIKTFATPYRSTVSDIVYDHINYNQVGYPIIIDQRYVQANSLYEGSSRVKISGVRFNDLQGSSKTQIAVNMQCSLSNPCEKLEMRNINLEYQGSKGLAKSSCSNAYGVSYGKQNPPSCLIKQNFST